MSGTTEAREGLPAAPQVADFRSLYLTHVALALVIAMLCLRIDTAPPKRAAPSR